MAQQALFINDAHSGIVQLLAVWQVPQALQIKRHQELLRRHKRIGRTTARATRPGRDEIPRMKSTNQVTTDLLAKDVFQPITRNRLVVGFGSGVATSAT